MRAIFDARIGERRNRIAQLPGHPFLCDLGVDVRKRMQQALGMPTRCSSKAEDVRWEGGLQQGVDLFRRS